MGVLKHGAGSVMCTSYLIPILNQFAVLQIYLEVRRTQGPLLARRERKVGTGAQSAGISWFSPWDPPDLLGFWLCRGESVRAGDASAFRLGRLHYSSDPKLHCTSCPKCFVRSTVHKHCVALCCIGVLVAHRLDLEQSLPANKKKGWTATANRSPEVGLDRKAKARLCTPHIPILRSRILSETGQNSKSAFRSLFRTPQSWIRVVASMIILYWARETRPGCSGTRHPTR